MFFLPCTCLSPSQAPLVYYKAAWYPTSLCPPLCLLIRASEIRKKSGKGKEAPLGQEAPAPVGDEPAPEEGGA